MGVRPVSGARAVFLDRDGVLNRTLVRNGVPTPPKSTAELQITEGAGEALHRLRARGFRLVVVTNQPDVARGRQTREVVEAMHAALRSTLPIDEFRVCYHDDADRCNCRKPAAGLLMAAAHDLHVDLTASFMVGDRWRDIDAGRRAGCRTVLVGSGYHEREEIEPDVQVDSLAEAADWIVAQADDAPAVPDVGSLSIEVFADGADLDRIRQLGALPFVKGFTTNPTLMRRAGVANYRAFAEDALRLTGGRPISFEVFSDDVAEMERQARAIAAWGGNVFVKIPVTDTRGEPTYDLVRRLASSGVQTNVTAVLTLDQVRAVGEAVRNGAPCYVSVFAGRIADTGRDPVPLMAAAVALLRQSPNARLIWASPRELLNIFQAETVGCHVITVTDDLLRKVELLGKDLSEYSLETVRMFHDDATRAGYRL